MRVDFSKCSSVKIGAELEVAELNEVCDFDGFIIGNACNLLVGAPKQALAMLGGKFDYIKLDKDILRIGAKTSAKDIFDSLSKSAKFSEDKRSINDVGISSFSKITSIVENHNWIPQHVPKEKDMYDEMLEALSVINKSV